MSFKIRQWATDGDRKFVEQTFVDNYRDAHAAGMIAMEDWKAVMEPQIRKALARPGVRVLVAYNPEEDRESRADLYGWIAVESGHARPLVIFCYVKEPYRRLGIAMRLLKACGIGAGDGFYYATKTALMSKAARAIPNAQWHPLIIRFPPPSLTQGGEVASRRAHNPETAGSTPAPATAAVPKNQPL